MRYIKRCENCLHEVRFPLDKGVLLVTCPYCKYTFKVDPDDISTYIGGRFDLTPIHISQNLSSKYTPSLKTETIRTVIVFFLFFLLFLNLFKAFGGFSSQTNFKENPYENIPPQQSEPQETEDLEFI